MLAQVADICLGCLTFNVCTHNFKKSKYSNRTEVKATFNVGSVSS